MKISTKGRYAIRLMLDIALLGGEEHASLRDIAMRQQISEKYLEQIISLLKKAGYVESIRGSRGGYMLTKDPTEYTVGDILRLTEGTMAPVACLEDTENQCSRAGECISLRLWEKVNEAVEGVIDHTSLQDMLNWEAGIEDE